MNVPNEEERAFFAANGYLIAPDTLDPESCNLICGLFDLAAKRPGTRLGLEEPYVRGLASGNLCQYASTLLWGDASPVRAIFFTKSVEANWLVPWHQDVTLAMPKKVDLEGARAWTQKEGRWHVQPPVSILNRMVALRVHVDPCGPDDGPLRIIPGSHLDGRLREPDIEYKVRKSDPITLVAEPGQVIAVHPLTLHSSPKATGTSHRRVLHIEYCDGSVYPWN